MDFEIREGDRVQARMTDGDNVVMVSEFTVTGTDGGVVTGSPIGPLGDGWSIELIRRGDPLLPTTPSELAVWLVEDQTTPVRVIGPLSGVWQTAQGRRIDPADVLHWEAWQDPEEAPTT